MKKFVLASASLGRRELLENARIAFVIDPSSFEEDMSQNMPPEKLAEELAIGKARDVAKRHKNAVIVAADSFVVYKNKLLGKPKNAEDAKRMLRELSGTEHELISGYAIIDTSSHKEKSGVDSTIITFRKITKDEIDKYVASENTLIKAGAYSMQHLGSIFITKIDGHHFSAMGLPLTKIVLDLKAMGIDIFDFVI